MRSVWGCQVGAGATPIGPAPTSDRKESEGRRGDIGLADVTRIRHDDLDPGSGLVLLCHPKAVSLIRGPRLLHRLIARQGHS